MHNQALWSFLSCITCCCCCCLVTKSCLTPCHPLDCSPPGSSVSVIFQARILQWVGIFFSRGSSWPRNWPRSPALAGGSFTAEPPGKLLWCMVGLVPSYLWCCFVESGFEDLRKKFSITIMNYCWTSLWWQMTHEPKSIVLKDESISVTLGRDSI